MHLSRARLAHHFNNLAAGGAAHDGIIHQHHALALQHGAIGAVLQLHAQIADLIRGFNEGAPDIMIADDAKLKRDAGFHRIAHRRRHAGIRHWNNQIRRNAAFARQFRTNALACFINRRAFHDAVRPREIDIFKNTKAAFDAAEGLDAAQAVIVNHHQFARFDVAHKFRAHDIQSAGLRRQHQPAIGQPPQHQRTHTKRITRPNQRAIMQSDQRIGALHLLQRINQPINHGGIKADGDQMNENFRIRCALEQATAPHQGALQCKGIGQIAIMRHRKTAKFKIRIKRLHIAQRRFARGRIAIMPHRMWPAQRCNNLGFPEIIANQAKPLMGVEQPGLIQRDNARRFLAAMLQRMQPKRGQCRCVATIPHAEDAAFFMRLVILELCDTLHGQPQFRLRAGGRSNSSTVGERGKGGSFRRGRYSAGMASTSIWAPCDRSGRDRASSTGSGQRSPGSNKPATI